MAALFFLLSAIFFLIDQISKFCAQSYGFFVYRNYGIIFGLGSQNPFFAPAVYAAVWVLLIFLFFKIFRNRPTLAQTVSMALILGGALGNSFDRLIFGYVLDIFDWRRLLSFWPNFLPRYFNLADVMILLGLLFLVLILFVGTNTDKSSGKR